MQDIKIYTRPGCDRCTRAKQSMLTAEIKFEVLTIGTDVTRDSVLAKFPDSKSLPIITLDGVPVTLEAILGES